MEIKFAGCKSEYWKEKINLLKERYPKISFFEINRDFGREDIEFTDVLITYRLKKEQVEFAKRLKYLFVPYAGLNNFPLQVLKNKNIIVCNSHENTKYVAERAFALTLALLGKIVLFHNDLKKGFWHREGLYREYWESLRGKKCSIIGTGSIGVELAKLLKIFSCEIMGAKRNLKNGERINNFDSLTDDINKALSFGQIIYLTLPLTKETENLINEKNICLLEGKYLVNVSRGKVVDEKVLFDSLKNKILKGAALDVWYNYPKEGEENNKLPSNYPIYELDNVVISPHKGAHTEGAEKGDIDFTVRNLTNLLEGRELKNIVDLDKGY
ncbi:MAG: Phosphoglycerate dehydrogenase-like oxidoreductase [candidate division TA06 bacterium 32_111]|uniref:Phosphoglycerate dehydrogenase-like oxidoreductase n=2 Tax=Bacteria candidate phyla TaxID=1783234 RepID=A0A124G0F4_UNCT6|nr:MAG: Phosphoglycerate dehydrogenase-like oxidoreductase [candidate division TA06 bacterium 32_111]KUK87310.1 MAG: Phosphoglycerate dehydrogenase-like oxidoreductase [candidate division TA06 bacterium 34_109]HAF07556.1 hydroxyacid dehydrogenase [candidate division WOR-3 bacterium]HCP16805.1 hydroxyacid dehydrogenase [candidate division WOR-3 bacterium]